MKIDSYTMLKYAFVFGAIVDGTIAISWLLIASGLSIPNILNGHVGNGEDYQLAMFIAAMFLLGWGVILAWGSINPVERRGVLIITAVFLLISVALEVMFFSDILGGGWFIFGVSKRIFLIILFSTAYFHSFIKPNNQ